jgi:hypothetical protein
MRDLRSLITRGIEALEGKSFPRRVTAVNGSVRWQDHSGRSFETREEAHKSNALPFVRNGSKAELQLKATSAKAGAIKKRWGQGLGSNLVLWTS